MTGIVVTLKRDKNGNAHFYKNGLKSNLIYTPTDFFTYKQQYDKWNWDGELNIIISTRTFNEWFKK